VLAAKAKIETNQKSHAVFLKKTNLNQKTCFCVVFQDRIEFNRNIFANGLLHTVCSIQQRQYYVIWQ
jgi:hypothetical protein